MVDLTLRVIDWQARRIIASRFPPVSLFERIVDPDEYDIAYYIESLTNDRLRQEAGDLALVPPEQRICGPGSTPVMASFTHIGHASRFTDGSYGVYYAANNSATAIAETAYHRARFLAATAEPDTSIFMREYVGAVLQPMADISSGDFAYLHHPDDYTPSQVFASAQRARGHAGLLYLSVRNPGGFCLAAFKPNALQPVVQAAHYEYFYSASQRKIKYVLEVKEVAGF